MQRLTGLVSLVALAFGGACSNDYDQFSVTSGTGASATGGTGGTTTSAGGTGGSGATGGSATGGTGGQPAGCGDGTLGAGEGCDDGHTTNNDGCSSTCDLEGAAGDVCPTGYDIDLSPPGIWIGDTTTGHNTNNNTSCGGNSAPDLAFRFLPSQGGTVNVDLTGNFNKVLAIRDACTNSPGSFCQTSQNDLTTSLQATQGQAFHVIVSGSGGANGPFTLHVYY